MLKCSKILKREHFKTLQNVSKRFVRLEYARNRPNTLGNASQLIFCTFPAYFVRILTALAHFLRVFVIILLFSLRISLYFFLLFCEILFLRIFVPSLCISCVFLRTFALLSLFSCGARLARLFLRCALRARRKDPFGEDHFFAKRIFCKNKYSFV